MSVLDILGRLGRGAGAAEDLSADVIRAFHGSPARFSRFNDAKIQDPTTAGWAHYLSEFEPLAASWQKTDNAPVYVYDTQLHLKPDQVVDYFGDLGSQPHALKAWQSILEDVSPNVRDSMRVGSTSTEMLSHVLHGPDPLSSMKQSGMEARLAHALTGPMVGRRESYKRVAHMLREAGLPASRVWDPRIPDGMTNYAVRDAKLIEILRRYRAMGLAGGGILGALAGADADSPEQVAA